MPFIKWDKSLSVKVKEIDEQHKKLIEIIDSAHAACKKRKKDCLDKILDELIEYVRTHFSTEEKYFEQYGYPDKNEHMEEHSKLISNVLNFKDRFDKGEDIIDEFLKFLKDWIEDHLKTMDHKYVDFFQSVGLK